MTDRGPTDQRCPVCREGVVAEITWDVEPDAAGDAVRQEGDSRQLTRYSCGHEVVGSRMDTADADRLDVERRRSEETT